MTRAPYESAAAPTSHSATDPAEFNVVCRSKSNLPNQTDSNAALLPYLTHQLGSAHEWSGVWNGPKALRTKKKRACAIGNLGVFSTQQTEHFFTLVKLFVFLFHARAKSCAVTNCLDTSRQTGMFHA